MADIIRRRGMLNESGSSRQELYVGTSLYRKQTNGSITANNDGTITVTSTSQGWNLYFARIGDTSLFPTYGSVKGKTLTVEVDTEWLSTSKGTVQLTMMLSTTTSTGVNGGSNRKRYKDITLTSYIGSLYTYQATVDDSFFSSGTAAFSDDYYMIFSFFLYAGNGRQLLVKSLHFYIE